MQPTWFNGRDDTERGSAHALSQPLAIPRARSLPAASAAQPNTDSLFRSLLFQPSGGLSHKPGGASTSPASLSASLSASAGALPPTVGAPPARPALCYSLKRDESFGAMAFVGGEEEAHDHWHDKWSTRRRTSMEEETRQRDAAAVVFGGDDVKRPVAVRGDPTRDVRPAERNAPARRDDIYGGNFWG
jgi:hypothetical protein